MGRTTLFPSFQRFGFHRILGLHVIAPMWVVSRAPPASRLAFHPGITQAAPIVATGMLAIVFGMNRGGGVCRGAVVYSHVYPLRLVGYLNQSGRPSSSSAPIFCATIAGRGPVRSNPSSYQSSTVFAVRHASGMHPEWGRAF